MNSVRPERAAARRAVASMVALSTGALLALSTAGPAVAVEGEAPQERVLQSVDVQMAPDGTLTTIDGTVVQSTGEDPEDADTSDSEYAPDEVAPQLPVRVMTAWRTEDGVGTDLADLDGYDGEIRIDLTVQNLTVKPEPLTYDVEGQLREQAALVGAPLTVVAAADLGELPADSVVTAGQGPTTDATNGVLGKDQGGQTQVQWASILAPPQLSASARFSLVVDAKDFEVPDLDISVQPGLVTDPSLGALVDSTFGPRGSQETQLQQDTISLISDVNGVLARAGGTISEVRQILSGSAETLGDKTVADLQSSTQSIATSMRTLGSALGSLDQQITTTLKDTESAALTELQSAVQTVDQLLGDTRGGAGSAQVLGDGCSYQVRNPGQGGSLYDSMVAVATQLNGYAQANDQCRQQLTSTLLITIGPDEPTEEVCEDPVAAESVSCSLAGAREVFEGVADDLKNLSGEFTELLKPGNYTNAVDYASDIVDATAEIQTIATNLKSGRLGVAKQVDKTLRELVKVHNELNAIGTASGSIDDALASAELSLGTARTAQSTAAIQVCARWDEPNTPSDGVGPSDADNVSLRLVGTYCGQPTSPAEQDVSKSGSTALNALSDELQVIRDQNSAVRNALDAARGELGTPSDEPSAVQEPYDREADEPASIFALLKEARAVAEAGQGRERNLEQLVVDLTEAAGVLNTAANGDGTEENPGLDAEVQALKDNYDDFQVIADTVDSRTDQAVDDLRNAVDPEIRKVTNAGATASSRLNDGFNNGSNRMGDLADQLVIQGRDSIEEQKREFTSAQQQAAEGITGQIRQGLARIGDGVTASTRDMSAATSLLTADLRKVLLDLGQREVNGGGLLGAMTTSAQTAKSADVQLSNATSQTSAYSNVRSADIAGILLRQAQAKAAMEKLARMPAFELDLSAGTLHRTVYNYRIGDGQ